MILFLIFASAADAQVLRVDVLARTPEGAFSVTLAEAELLSGKPYCLKQKIEIPAEADSALVVVITSKIIAYAEEDGAMSVRINAVGEAISLPMGWTGEEGKIERSVVFRIEPNTSKIAELMRFQRAEQASDGAISPVVHLALTNKEEKEFSIKDVLSAPALSHLYRLRLAVYRHIGGERVLIDHIELLTRPGESALYEFGAKTSDADADEEFIEISFLTQDADEYKVLLKAKARARLMKDETGEEFQTIEREEEYLLNSGYDAFLLRWTEKDEKSGSETGLEVGATIEKRRM